MFAQTLVVGLLLAAPPAAGAGPRLEKGLEVLFAPAPKQLTQAYGEEEMFIG